MIFGDTFEYFYAFPYTMYHSTLFHKHFRDNVLYVMRRLQGNSTGWYILRHQTTCNVHWEPGIWVKVPVDANHFSFAAFTL